MVSQKQISAIEIKNWSGRLRISGDRWIQERRNGEEISHENPLEKNREKLDCLCSMLETRNIRVPSARVCRVIFWNKNLNIPIEVAKRDEIVMNHELDRFRATKERQALRNVFSCRFLNSALTKKQVPLQPMGFSKRFQSMTTQQLCRQYQFLRHSIKLNFLGEGDIRRPSGASSRQ